MELIWEQEAAGSNPAIPTRFFECVVNSLKQVRGAARYCLMSVGVAEWLCTLAPTLQTDTASVIWSNFSSAERPESGHRSTADPRLRAPSFHCHKRACAVTGRSRAGPPAGPNAGAAGRVRGSRALLTSAYPSALHRQNWLTVLSATVSGHYSGSDPPPQLPPSSSRSLSSR